MTLTKLIATEDVASVDFFLNIIKNGIVAVGDDGLGLTLEFIQVIHNTAAEEGGRQSSYYCCSAFMILRS